MPLKGIEKRRFPRVQRCLPPSGKDDTSQVALLDLSAGGVCLWFRDLPSIKRLRRLRLSSEGQEWILAVRPVWLSECIALPEIYARAALPGWRVGLAFTPAQPGEQRDTPMLEVPPNAKIAVDFRL